MLAALCLAGTPGIQGKTLLEQIVPHPTGNNGYEEYLRAAQILRDPGAGIFLWWPEWAPSGDALAAYRAEWARLSKLSLLEVRREAVKRFGRALDLVRQGNAKPIQLPLGGSPMDTFPREFKAIAKFARMDAYVRWADGDSRGATDTLLQCLTFSSRALPDSIISYLVGIAIDSVLLAGFEERLALLSEHDARALIDHATLLLKSPSRLLSAIRGERQVQIARLNELPVELEQGRGSDSEDPLIRYLGSLNAAQRAQLVRLARAGAEEGYQKSLQLLSRPESEWVFEQPEEPESPETPQTVEEAAAWFTGPFPTLMPNLCRASATNMTQFRLLRLAARVIAFQWQHERLPPTLEDAAPAEEIADPLTGDKFQYTPMGETFRVFSKGVKATGEIDIRYRRAVGGRGPPPP